MTATRDAALRELAGPSLQGLGEALGDQGFDHVEIHGRAVGGTSTCYYLRAPRAPGLVFKRPLPGENLRHEYALLVKAAEARECLPMHLPQPVTEVGDGHGYVMERVWGTPSREWLARAGAARIQHTAVALVDALAAWHLAIGEPYGDFHSANVLLDPSGSLAFIDPGESSDVTAAAAEWPAASPLAADLGLWLHNCALDAPAMWARYPRRAHALRALSIELASLAARRQPNPDNFLSNLFARAALHGARLWHDPWLARRARAPLVRLALLELRRASFRRIAHA